MDSQYLDEDWQTLASNFKDYYTQYFLQTLPLFQKQNIFIEQNGLAANSNTSVPLLSALAQQLSSPEDSMKYFVVMADSGIGKTTLALQLTFKLWEMYELSAEHEHYIPVYIYITSTTSVVELNTILKAYLTYPRVILILDCYEQRLNEVRDFVEADLIFLHENIKFVVMCRTVPHLFFGNLVTQFQSQLCIFRLQKFTTDQMLQYADKFDRVDSDTEHVHLQNEGAVGSSAKLELASAPCAKKWLQELLILVPALKELAKIPLFLSILFQISPRLLEKFKKSGELSETALCLSKAEIFDYFVEYWFDFQIERNLLNSRDQDSNIQLLHNENRLKRYMFAYTQNLAETLVDSESGILYDDPISDTDCISSELAEPYCDRDLLNHYKTHFLSQSQYISDELANLLQFLRNCSLVVPESNGQSYRFLHRSFAEYFITRKIFVGLKSRFEFGSRGLTVSTNGEQNLLDTRSPKCFEVGFLQLLADRAVVNTDFADVLFAIIESSRENLTLTNLAANSITILNLAGASFEGKNFIDVQIPNAILIGAKLANVNFQKANLGNVDFSQAWLSGANFEGSNLNGATFGQIEISTGAINTGLAIWKDCRQPAEPVNILVGCRNGSIYFYRQKSGESKFEIARELRHSKRKIGFIDIHVSGNLLLSCMSGMELKFWNLVSGKMLFKMSMDVEMASLDSLEIQEKIKQRFESSVFELTADKVGKFLAMLTFFHAHKILLYSLEQVLLKEKPKLFACLSTDVPVLRVMINSQGTYIALSTLQALELRDITNPHHRLLVLCQPEKDFSIIRFSPDGNWLSYTQTKYVKIWNLQNVHALSKAETNVTETLKIGIRNRDTVIDASFTSENQNFIVCTSDSMLSSANQGCYLNVYSLSSGQLRQVINTGVEIRSLQPFNGLVATISQDFRSAHESFKPKLLQIWYISDWAKEAVDISDTVNDRPFFHVAISPAIDWLATAHVRRNADGAESMYVYLWNLVTGRYISMIDVGDVGKLVYMGVLHNGSILVLGNRGEIKGGKPYPHENLKILSVVNSVDKTSESSEYKLNVEFSCRLAVREEETDPYRKHIKFGTDYNFSVMYSAELDNFGTKLAVADFHDVKLTVYGVDSMFKDSTTYSWTPPANQPQFKCDEYMNIGDICFHPQSSSLLVTTNRNLVCWNFHDHTVVYWIPGFSPNFDLVDTSVGSRLVVGDSAVYTATAEQIKVYHQSKDELTYVSKITVSNMFEFNPGIVQLGFAAESKMLFAALSVDNEILAWKEVKGFLDPVLLKPPLKLWSKIWNMHIFCNNDSKHISIVLTDLHDKLSLVKLNTYTMTWTLAWSNSPSFRLFVQNAMINEIVSPTPATVELLAKKGAQGVPASKLQTYLRSTTFKFGLPGTAFSGVEYSIFCEFLNKQSVKGSGSESLELSENVWTVSAISTHTRRLDPFEHVSLLIEGIKDTRRFVFRAELIAELDSKRVAIRVRPFRNRNDLEYFVARVTKCRSWSVSKERGNKLIMSIRDSQLTPMEYNVRDKNCVVWSLETLKECGVEVHRSKYNSLFVLPKNIFENAYTKRT